jgi:hypothetical protein
MGFSVMAGDDPSGSDDTYRTQAHRDYPDGQEAGCHHSNRYQPESSYSRSEQASSRYPDGNQTHGHRSDRHHSYSHGPKRYHALCRVTNGDDTSGAPRRGGALTWTQGNVDERQTPPGTRRTILERHRHLTPSAADLTS